MCHATIIERDYLDNVYYISGIYSSIDNSVCSNFPRKRNRYNLARMVHMHTSLFTMQIVKLSFRIETITVARYSFFFFFLRKHSLQAAKRCVHRQSEAWPKHRNLYERNVFRLSVCLWLLVIYGLLENVL